MRQGIERTRTFVLKSENQASVMTLAMSNISSDAVICADESNAYDPLHGKFIVKRVNHSLEYRADDGTTNNYAESFFSVLIHNLSTFFDWHSVLIFICETPLIKYTTRSSYSAMYG